MSVPPPKGYRTVSAYLIAKDADAVVSFAETVFGAHPIEPPLRDAERGLRHVALGLGDSVVMLGGSPDGSMTQTAMLHVYVADCDATYAKALAAGGEEVREPIDEPYGDRSAGVRDAAGNIWWIATRVEDVPPEEVARRMAAQKGT